MRDGTYNPRGHPHVSLYIFSQRLIRLAQNPVRDRRRPGCSTRQSRVVQMITDLRLVRPAYKIFFRGGSTLLQL